MLQPITPTLQTLFADLVQQVETAPLAGTPYRRERDGIAYHYAKIPVGAGRADTFIGRADDPVADAQVEDLRRGMALARSRRSTVSMLRGRLAGPDATLGAIMDAIMPVRRRAPGRGAAAGGSLIDTTGAKSSGQQ